MFATHNAAQLEQDYDLLYKDMHKTSKPKSHNMDYAASPSVQRRGGFKNVAHSAGDSNKIVAHFVGESQEKSIC